MIQDIFPHRLNNHYDPGRQITDQSRLLLFHDRELLVKDSDGPLDIPRRLDFGSVKTATYLFTVDQEDFFLLEDEEVSIPKGCAFVPVRNLRRRNYGPKHLIFAAITASQLSVWYRNNRFCGRCGKRTGRSETERAIVCPSCGNVIYPHIVPAVIAAVTDGDRIILTKYAGRNMPFYALIAGFTEIGETLEETVRREVMEEVGLQVKNIRYYKSQPWGIVDDILAGYFCDVDGDTRIHMDTNELKLAEWVDRKDVSGQPDDFSLTNEMMVLFREGKEPK